MAYPAGFVGTKDMFEGEEGDLVIEETMSDSWASQSESMSSHPEWRSGQSEGQALQAQSNASLPKRRTNWSENVPSMSRANTALPVAGGEYDSSNSRGIDLTTPYHTTESYSNNRGMDLTAPAPSHMPESYSNNRGMDLTASHMAESYSSHRGMDLTHPAHMSESYFRSLQLTHAPQPGPHTQHEEDATAVGYIPWLHSMTGRY